MWSMCSTTGTLFGRGSSTLKGRIEGLSPVFHARLGGVATATARGLENRHTHGGARARARFGAYGWRMVLGELHQDEICAASKDSFKDTRTSVLQRSRVKVFLGRESTLRQNTSLNSLPLGQRGDLRTTPTLHSTDLLYSLYVYTSFTVYSFIYGLFILSVS